MRILFIFVNTLLLLSSTVIMASVPLGAARKGTDGHYDMYGCMHSNDYYIVNFGAYQIDTGQTISKKNLPVAECVNLPKTGKTQIAIDMLDVDVRRKPVTLKIFQADNQVISETPMTVPKQGVISTEVDFKAPGHYQAVLYVDDTDLKMPQQQTALQIPLTVGLAMTSPAAKNTMMGLFIVLGLSVIGLAFLLPRLLKPRPA